MDTEQATDQPLKHICGQCGDEWLTEDEYIAHKCPVTGFSPADPEHLGPEFKAVQEAALARGAEAAAAAEVATDVAPAAQADTISAPVQ